MIVTRLSGARRLVLFGPALLGWIASGCGGDKITGPQPPAAVASVSVAIATPTLTAYPRAGAAGSTTQATAIPRDANGNSLAGRPIIWSTEKNEVATVSVDGVVTAVAPGTATITATSEGKTGSATVTVSAPVPQVKQRLLAVGARHACAVALDGYMYCWGWNHSGQLGTWAWTTSTPLQVLDGHKFSAVGAAGNTTYAVTPAGELYCWGGIPCDPTAGNPIDEYNGPAVINPRRMPTQRTIEVLGPGGGSGYDTGCAIGVSNLAYCWGTNTQGALGLGFVSNDTVLVPDRPVVGNHVFVEIAAQGHRGCALTASGAAYCWGVGTLGGLGDGSGSNSAEPRAVAGHHVFKMIDVGFGFSCGLTTDGKAYCWGNNEYGSLGVLTGTCLGAAEACSATPVAVGGGHIFESLASGGFDSCGITANGDVYCWGYNYGSTPQHVRAVIANEPVGVRFKSVATTGNQMCAISATGDAWCRYQDSDHLVLVPGGFKFRTP